MKHINRYLILIMCLFLVLSFPIQAEEAEQTFHLKSGDKIIAVPPKQHPAFQGVGEKGIHCQSRAIPW